MKSTQRFIRPKRTVAFMCAVVLFSLHTVDSSAQADQEDLRAEVKALLERVRALEAEVETLEAAQVGTAPSAPESILSRRLLNTGHRSCRDRHAVAGLWRG